MEARTMTRTLNPADVLTIARDFTKRRPSAELLHKGPEERFQPLGWFPKLRGQFVRNAGDPDSGFASRDEALEPARTYRRGCADFVAAKAAT
jgi:hypothetical protein